MKKIFFLLGVIALVSSSCKKNRTCACYNPGGEAESFIVNDTKNNTESICQKYYDENYGYYFSETYCKIK